MIPAQPAASVVDLPDVGSMPPCARRPGTAAAVWRSVTRALALLALAGCGVLSSGQRPEGVAPGAEGVIGFATTESLQLSGALELPRGDGPVPAVVLMHDCQGPSAGAIRGWQTALVTWGYATLVVDGFASRSVTNVCEGADKLWPAERVPDAYAALLALARNPRIASARIALMGWGDGATAALWSASAPVAQKYAGATGPRFRAVIAVYPTCRVFGPASTPVTDFGRLTSPVRIHVGELDDWAPPQACEALVARWKQAGQDADLTVFPGARHLFDSVGRAAEELAGVDNYGGDRHRKGARVAWSPDATRAARANVRDQLERLLGAPPPK
jgi:dienelactone hydrolase